MSEATILTEDYTIRVIESGTDAVFEPDIPNADRCWYECRDGRLHRCCQTPSGIFCQPLPFPCLAPESAE